ncbi:MULTISPECIES: mannose-1-phosphate guanylyltransferase [Chryseobacterium]|uniref:Mannose-1-phosphate guanylyltransferase n=1 Tax=Chryseobacterium camelliae TaxID=1265445 RepID=A0ABU0TDF4_9FLAO|nr:MULTISPECIES: sugar phosphate nucleotidyltransferase [Chryseobacterium]MDT3407098.1 mannose-1-phosphate guanylyltransferase [Pseudacidovorax intermedius]MDQ1095110.1 mannose-1-phosphate guanylyltransferase [Chryseobacterium camelliae]MDQ1099048.1 mannose-1-phosphate guanylyltransferase [Chryseobacterium sp. SORGH_AS_1048]MDR6086397.1 mannose-1-phosphate guanylyltransferase [Chryseobacterium sp. SORGH_AS_0909]MDR6130769.1 mannose-1-phosphate guanylyltransferase [Chryseobacterium sp. SORGH_AS
MKKYNVILSGGIGSRLWPLSRKQHPKQFLKLFSGKALFELTAERNQKLVDEIMVVGNTDHIEWSKQLLQDICLPKTFITETAARNTAAAIAFAALAVDPDDILIITPSDHLIQNQDDYEQAIKQAVELGKKDFLVTFGVVPSRPETGYGYIEYEGKDVLSFREKPNTETAQEFLERGTFLWNSGMFCFKAGIFLEELKRYQPEILEKCMETWQISENYCLDTKSSLQIPSISIDYAVMERSKKIKVVPAYFRWNDLGSFESLYDYLRSAGHPVDDNGNMVIGTDIFTAFVGLKDSILVHTPDAILILQKERSQDVKKIYNQLEKYKSTLR